MNSRFGSLFRTSKAASWDPRIQQVYTTFNGGAKIGDWGVKYSLPTAVRTKYLTIQKFDTKESFPMFESAANQVKIARTLRENFKRSRTPKLPLSAQTQESSNSGVNESYNLAQMSKSQWEKFLKLARSKSKEWQEAVKEGRYESYEWLKFMNASNTKIDYTDTAVSSPTYHNYVPTVPETRIKGRILNRITVGYSVGIQGVVGQTIQSKNSPLRYGATRDPTEFYVSKFKFDGRGRPDIWVQTSPPQPRHTVGTYHQGSKSYMPHHSQGSTENKIGIAHERLKSLLDSVGHLGSPSSNKATSENSEAGSETKGISDPVKDIADVLSKSTRGNGY
ncbi:hypothetical protein H4219_001583 [Mycoemilia scoparia]|uniref:Uncharacterized protein n=1 Tax=Mycoemilia scoparia TaxID=417184 RepID=A0A9W8A970_9FUNG|nr:hypothetical protein H4219_001583 [Mycoemilia scoparia]